MNHREYLLLKIMEESSEVAHAAAKLMQYGEAGTNPHDPEHVNNLHALIKEQVQMLAAFQQYILSVKNAPTYEQLGMTDTILDKMLESAVANQVWMSKALTTNNVIKEY
jgi:hypothetical protein